MKLPWKIVKRTYTESDEKIEQLIKLLFPPLVLNEELNKDGTVMKYHVDHSVDTNLDAALVDLQEGHNDPVVQKTINSVIKRLNDARRLLEAYAQFDKDAKYIIVEDMEDSDSENIRAQEEH